MRSMDLKRSVSLYLSVEPVDVLNEKGVNVSQIVNEFLIIHAFGQPKKPNNGNGGQPNYDQKPTKLDYYQAKETYGKKIADLLYKKSSTRNR